MGWNFYRGKDFGSVLATNDRGIWQILCCFNIAGICCGKNGRKVATLKSRANIANCRFRLYRYFSLQHLFFWRISKRVPAGRTSLFVSLTPIVTAVLAGLIFSERLGVRRWAGILVALIGAIVVITRGDLIGGITDISQSLGLGELMMLGAVFSWAAYTLISRKALETLSPIVATTYGTLWGFVFLTIGAIGEFKDVDWIHLDWRVWTSVFYLGAFGTVLAFIWFYQGIQTVGPSRTAIFTNLVPAFGVLFSAALLGEPILISMVVGGLIAVLGVSLVNKK